MNNLLWSLVSLQALLGLADILVHHEWIARLPWQVQAQRELWLHGLRNAAYVLFYLLLAWTSLFGWWVWLLVAVVVFELSVTFWDWWVEDHSRRLPVSEKLLHGALAINMGAILILLAQPLWQGWQQDSALVWQSHGWISWLLSAFAVGVAFFAVRDLAASKRLARWAQRCDYGPTLAGEISGQRHILVTGATGLIGSRLVPALLHAGHRVTVLTRRPQLASELGSPLTVLTSLDDLPGDTHIDAVIQLAGESVAGGLWTQRRRQLLVSSRLAIIDQVGSLIRRLSQPPEVWINASAIGWYGLADAERRIDEHTTAGPGFSHDLCASVEEAPQRYLDARTRLVNVRIGLVLAREGGYLGQLLVPTDMGAGTVLGNGQHWQSWVHRDDLVRLICFCIEHPIAGAVNGTAPQPARFVDLMRQLANRLHRPLLLRVPAPVLLWSLGDMAKELLLASQHVSPRKIQEHGFVFCYPQLDQALAQIL